MAEKIGCPLKMRTSITIHMYEEFRQETQTRRSKRWFGFRKTTRLMFEEESPKTHEHQRRFSLDSAADTHTEIRLAVAENSNTPSELLARLSRDINADVRYGFGRESTHAGGHPLSPGRGENPYVRVRAMKTLQNLSPDVQARLKQHFDVHHHHHRQTG